MIYIRRHLRTNDCMFYAVAEHETIMKAWYDEDSLATVIKFMYTTVNSLPAWIHVFVVPAENAGHILTQWSEFLQAGHTDRCSPKRRFRCVGEFVVNMCGRMAGVTVDQIKARIREGKFMRYFPY